MLDIKYIRENADKIKEAVKNKNIALNIDELLNLDKKRRELEVKIDELRAKRNELAYRLKGEKPPLELIKKGKKIKEGIASLEEDFREIDEQFLNLMALVPTIPSADTPIGKDESGNKVIYEWGEIPKFDFIPKSHIELGQKLDILDLERGAKVSGYRGYYLKNEGAILVMAIMHYALEKMISKGYTPMIPPTLVKEFVLFGTGYFKGRNYNPEVDEIYEIANLDEKTLGMGNKERKFLVGTAEPSLLAYYANEVLKEENLPLRLCGYSQCYRSEIGSYGKDTKGIYRVHEFMKVEQVILAKADIRESERLQEEMINITKEMHEELGLPYRQIIICTGDLSPGKYRQYDLEAWLPGLNRWGETGSASNFLDWQARRLNVKYLKKDGKKEFVYMLNNTGLPSPRIFIAILENYQQKDGSIKIPEVLQRYCGFKVIKSKSI